MALTIPRDTLNDHLMLPDSWKQPLPDSLDTNSRFDITQQYQQSFWHHPISIKSRPDSSWLLLLLLCSQLHLWGSPLGWGVGEGGKGRGGGGIALGMCTDRFTDLQIYRLTDNVSTPLNPNLYCKCPCSVAVTDCLPAKSRNFSDSHTGKKAFQDNRPPDVCHKLVNVSQDSYCFL